MQPPYQKTRPGIEQCAFLVGLQFCAQGGILVEFIH